MENFIFCAVDFKRWLFKQAILSNFLRKQKDSVEVTVKFREFTNYEISNLVGAINGDNGEIQEPNIKAMLGLL